MSGLNHFDEKGNAVMVDVSEKSETKRIAVAKGSIKVSKEIMNLIKTGNIKKVMFLVFQELLVLWQVSKLVI